MNREVGGGGTQLGSWNIVMCSFDLALHWDLKKQAYLLECREQNCELIVYYNSTVYNRALSVTRLQIKGDGGKLKVFTGKGGRILILW